MFISFAQNRSGRGVILSLCTMLLFISVFAEASVRLLLSLHACEHHMLAGTPAYR